MLSVLSRARKRKRTRRTHGKLLRRHQVLRATLRWRSAALLWLMIGFCSCNTTDPIHFVNVRDLRISTNVPGGTEGVPNARYTFTAIHSVVTVPIHYEWNFDDTLVYVVHDSGSIQHTFSRSGLYAVSVRVFNDQTSLEVARAQLVVNIRSGVPDIQLQEVPAGVYLMGSNQGIDVSEQPLHNVTISRPLLVGRYELRQCEWDMIMPTSPSWFRGDSLPVENVTWYEAIDYFNRLSIRSGLSPCYTINGDTVQCFFSSNGYRLPTEAEWEYFARAGTSYDFYSGRSQSPYAGCLSGDTLEQIIDTIGWYCLNSGGTTHPGGLKTPNAFGLYDVIGNVSEWTWDWYDGNYYRNSAPADPRGAASGNFRVVRGGDFSVGTIDSRVSSRRLSSLPALRSFHTGFRLVRSR